MALDATPKGITANAYLTEAEATTLLTTERLHSGSWLNLNTASREAALIWATRLLDQAFSWAGAPRTLQQALSWPRAGIVDWDGRYIDPDSVPKRIKLAAADLALALSQRDRLTEPELLGQGFSEASVGSLRVKVDPAMVLSLIPRSIILDLEQWGTPVGAAASGGMKVIKVSR